MKHTIELKLPKLFGKKKKDDETEVTTAVEVDDKTISTIVSVGVPLAIGLSVGYLVGHHKGVSKQLTSVVVVKWGELS